MFIYIIYIIYIIYVINNIYTHIYNTSICRRNDIVNKITKCKTRLIDIRSGVVTCAVVKQCGHVVMRKGFNNKCCIPDTCTPSHLDSLLKGNSKMSIKIVSCLRTSFLHGTRARVALK